MTLRSASVRYATARISGHRDGDDLEQRPDRRATRDRAPAATERARRPRSGPLHGDRARRALRDRRSTDARRRCARRRRHRRVGDRGEHRLAAALPHPDLRAVGDAERASVRACIRALGGRASAVSCSDGARRTSGSAKWIGTSATRSSPARRAGGRRDRHARSRWPAAPRASAASGSTVARTSSADVVREARQAQHRARARAAPSTPAASRRSGLHDAVERLHAALAVDEGAGGLGERRDRQQHVGVLACRGGTGSSRRRSPPAPARPRAATGLAQSNSGLGVQQQVGLARIGEHRRARSGRPRAGSAPATWPPTLFAASVRKPSVAPVISREHLRQRVELRRLRDAARRSCRAGSPCARRTAGSPRSPARRRGRLDAGQRGRHRLAGACARRDDDLGQRARQLRRRDDRLVRDRHAASRRRPSAASTPACPCFAAWRSRCATSGWSLRRKLPTTSTRSSASRSAIGMPEPRDARAAAVAAEIRSAAGGSRCCRCRARARAAPPAPSPRASRAATRARRARSPPCARDDRPSSRARRTRARSASRPPSTRRPA